MSRILDLTVFDAETLDITMPDKSVLHIVKPTQRMVINMLRMKDVQKKEPDEIMKSFNELSCAILNNNDNGQRIEFSFVENMPMRMKTAIITAYSNFITSLQSDPN
ncbi:MAG: hypothetical protein RR994_05555 [Clostridia bacterium]